ncbi:hypothetical protein DQQ10_07680 [Pseudochryseolinea flava]|uniref:Uncharacterized protein n=1 Tax=Pseudochryseolinea flava TaxID=2059302 RepID=A0A364Y595_9BACT|nr:hypothetical protein DQQ10_07680 [Pseudochryseolinea flava]
MLEKIRFLIEKINPDAIYENNMYKQQSSLLNEARGYLDRVESLRIAYPWKFGKRINSLLDEYARNIGLLNSDLNRRLGESGYN